MERERTAFCLECGCTRSYTLQYSRERITVKGIEFVYTEIHAVCETCGSEIYVPEINDANVDAREDGYRKAADLITASEVNEILEKYDIGAVPLAKLLGFGDVTISRYINGQLPSKSHSDVLKEIKRSYRAMETALEDGKDRITEIAYQKCRASIDSIKDLYGTKKIELVTRYLLVAAKEITPLALQKLLYYAQAFFFAIFHEILFEDDCQAWAYGPVYPEIYRKYKEYGFNPIEKPMEDLSGDFYRLTDQETSVLDAVVATFGTCSGPVLRDMTHNERPWLDARGDLPPEERSEVIIPRKSIEEYFERVVSQYQIINPCDIAKYCDTLLEQVR